MTIMMQKMMMLQSGANSKSIGHDDDDPGGSPVLPGILTTLTTAQLAEVLNQANRRGLVSEVTWDGRDRFRITVASRPMVTHLLGTIGNESDPSGGSPRRITFSLALDHKTFWLTLVITIASIVIGPITTEYFIHLYSWWWQPPLYALSALWIWLRWPRTSLAEGRLLGRKVIALINERITLAGGQQAVPVNAF